MVKLLSIHDASVYGSPDPAGLTYDPVTGRILLVDSEVDEKPFFSATNMFAIGKDGSFSNSYTLTTVTKEPTGVAYNGVTGTIFITDDDANRVYEVSRDDPTVVISSFSTTSFGSTVEDIAVAKDGTLYILDEASRKIWHTSTDGTVISSIQLPSSLKRPEAIAYDPREDVFYVAGGWSADIFKVNSSGAIVDKITVLRPHRNEGDIHVMPKALALVPSADPDGAWQLWVGDYGADQVDDGRLFVIELDPPPPPPQVSVLDASPAPQTEGDGRQVSFAITLSKPMTDDVVVTFNTIDGTAKAGTDYVGITGGTAVIAAGATTTTVFVNLINDNTAEPQEAFSLVLKSATKASSGEAVKLGDTSGLATVVDDDTGSSPKVVVYDTTVFGSPDPSGLTYVSTWGRVILSDSEVTEKPFFSDTNAFVLGTHGAFHQGLNLTAFTKEATGVAHWHDAAGQRDLLFVTDDDTQSVYIVDMSDLSKPLARISTTAFGCDDPEDVDVDPTNGHLYVVSESSRTIYEITQEGTLVSTIVLPSTIKNPEAVAYDAQADAFYVSGFFSYDIFKVSRDGVIIETIKALREHDNVNDLNVVPKGLALVPDGNGGRDLWVADYGLDQVADGRILVIDLDDPASMMV